MKNYCCTFLFLFFINAKLFCQAPDIPYKYAETITQDGLKKQLTIIASAGMEGRETGTEGQRKAAAYIESQFKEIGLTSPPSLDNYQQNYPIYKDTLLPKTLKIGKRKYKFGKDYIISPGSGSNDIDTKNIVFAGYGISDKNYDDYAGKDVKGKLVLVCMGEPMLNGAYVVSGSDKPSSWSRSITRRAAIAYRKGAAGLLLLYPNMDTISSSLAESSKKSNLYFIHEKNSDNENVCVLTVTAQVISDILGKQEAAALLKNSKEMAPLKDISISKDVRTKLSFKKIKIQSSACNVIGYVEGSDKKDEYVFLTGHYDHLGKKDSLIYYGADDDGSGTVSVIEMAAAFAKAKADGYGPRRTIVFMTVSGEEKGLWGSEYYSDHPLFPLDSTAVDLNTDMIGRRDPGRKYGDSTNYIYVIGDDKLSSDLKPISTTVNNAYTKLELDYKFNDPKDPERIYYRSDHYNFARKGVPIIFFFDGIHKDYHKPTDTVDKINFDEMEKRARLIFLTAWNIANRSDMLKRDIPLPTE